MRRRVDGVAFRGIADFEAAEIDDLLSIKALQTYNFHTAQRDLFLRVAVRARCDQKHD